MHCLDEITFDDVSAIHSLCLFKGEPHQIVNRAAIESALGNQYQPYSSHELAYASVYKSLILNHGFMNGNKRTAVITLYIASVMMGNEIKITDRELAELTYRIASENGGQVSVEEIAKKVFKCFETRCYFKEIGDIACCAQKYINEHEWLMRELGK